MAGPELHGGAITSAAPHAVTIDGKQFACAGERFRLCGATYGTFAPRASDGARFPVSSRVAEDFAAMATAGFNVVRCYTEPPEDVLELAAASGLRVLADAFYPDWRYLMGGPRRADAAVRRAAVAQVRATARRLAGDERVLALSLGNEIPGDVIRWVGTARIAAFIDELAAAVRQEDPARLVTYANYPTAEYLPLHGLDFLMFNVFLERQEDFRAYLTRLQHLSGDRPLVLGELGLNAGGGPEAEARQAEVLDWQLETALERGIAGTCVFAWTDEWCVGDQMVEGWSFGLTRADRSPRPALEVAAGWNRATVSDLNHDWPSISVVVCAHNSAETLDECLQATTALSYPDLEVIVVNDGSADETAAIAAGYDVRLVEIEHSGLSAARNAGVAAARGELVAFLDSDAYPTPEWPYYLALGMDGPHVAGTGGPNVPPPSDPRGAQLVARAPGGPVHVLLGDARAEHVPGCNMAFWRDVLEDIGGFDPIYTAAGDDVDVCWKVLDRGWEIGFHPAALVWHHRRDTLRGYLRQQRGYGRADALVEARHPQRFTRFGTARWRGHIYDSFAPRLLRQRVYRGMFGASPFQAVYPSRGDGRALSRQLGVPVATMLLPTGALGALSLPLAIPAAVSALILLATFLAEAVAVQPPRKVRGPRVFRAQVAMLSMLQPLVRLWGRLRHGVPASGLERSGLMPEVFARPGRGVLVFGADRPREQLVGAIIHTLRAHGLRAFPSLGWDDYDASMIASSLVRGQLVTSSHPPGCVQVRVRRRLRPVPLLVYCAAAIAGGLAISPAVAVVCAVVGVAEIARGAWRTGPLVLASLQGSPAAQPDRGAAGEVRAPAGRAEKERSAT